MLRIPAGEFIYLDGERRTVQKPFWIDKYEVTIAQYAQFLDALAANPTTSYDHPDQAKNAPDKVGHTPDNWDELYEAAKQGRSFQGSQVDVNCPVILVDWWDAHAYAKWKGHRLPTEEEWTKRPRAVPRAMSTRGGTNSISPNSTPAATATSSPSGRRSMPCQATSARTV